MPSNNIAFARNYTSVIDEVYQRASVSGVLKGKGRPADGMRKDALGDRIDHAMAWASTSRTAGDSSGKASARR